MAIEVPKSPCDQDKRADGERVRLINVSGLTHCGCDLLTAASQLSCPGLVSPK